MSKNNPQRTSISKAQSFEEVADFWDTHSLADYWDQTSEVEFEVRAKRRSWNVLNQAEQGERQSQALNNDKL
ncbi:MAG: hypothetical protein M3437_10780 [Chloroflexota bacterium]|nr:hypothetical protein [Chloroflexota bacterium]MDQ5867443.1 hypothetical protein [Chloroflexota bacterium]